MVGPNRTSTSLSLASDPSSIPSLLIKSISHVEPSDMALGKHADGWPELPSPLTPLGPSDIFMLGIFSLSILWVCQASNPLKS